MHGSPVHQYVVVRTQLQQYTLLYTCYTVEAVCVSLHCRLSIPGKVCSPSTSLRKLKQKYGPLIPPSLPPSLHALPLSLSYPPSPTHSPSPLPLLSQTLMGAYTTIALDTLLYILRILVAFRPAEGRGHQIKSQ